MLSLPLLNAQLLPCARRWEELLPGRYCANCERSVVDFSALADPAAALAAASAVSPNGRVCGRFGVAQIAQPQLRPRLRRFLVALVLIVGLGLPAHEALAQVRQAKPTSRPAVAEPGFMGVVVEQMPTYKAGGVAGLQLFIKQHLHYPQGAAKTGRLFVSFTVTEHGKAAGFNLAKGPEPLLDAEVLRVMHQMGSFTPGQQNGRPVAVRFTLPITFAAP